MSLGTGKNDIEKEEKTMKYFKRGWYANPKDVDRIIESYDRYYRTIKNQLLDNIKQVINIGMTRI